MKKILLSLTLLISTATFAQVQYGGYATENGSKFTFSTVNSTTSQLTAGATFTGAVESVLSQRSFSLLFFSDQNATITINQFIDAAGAKNIQQLVFTYTASSKFARSGALNGNYIQVIVQNTGGSTTTTLQANMAYGNIDAATQLNNLPNALMEINGTAVDQNSGNKSAGSQRVVIATDDINLAAINTATSSINTKTPALGQASAGNSSPVTLSNQNVQDSVVTGQSAQTATVNNILTATSGTAATNVSGYRSASVQIVCPAGTYTTGAIIFEGSNDNTNFVTIPVYNQVLVNGAPITAAITLVTTTNIVYVFPITTTYIRCRISTGITGASASVQAFPRYSQTPFSPPTVTIANATAANANVTASIAATQTLSTVTTVGTVTTLSTASTLNGGPTAASAASANNPNQTGGVVVPTTIATQDATYVAGDVVKTPMTTGAQAVTKSFSTSELDYTFHNTSAVTTVTLQQIVPASGTANVRNYITGLTIESDLLGGAGNVWVLDGQGAIGTSVTIATPGVFTSSAHDLKVGDAIVFTSLGTITGVSTNTVYYITATSFAATTFTIATTQGGTALQITGSTSAFTFYRLLYPIRVQTAALGAPAVIVFPTPLKGIANSATNLLIPTSLTSGNIYLTVNGYRGF